MMWYVYLSAAMLAALVVAGVLARRRSRRVDHEAYLDIRSGVRAGSRIHLRNVCTRIGSSQDNDLVLTDDGVSRHHLRITYGRGVFQVEDLNSLYGTFADGERIERRELASGQILTLGKSVDMQFRIGELHRIPERRRVRCQAFSTIDSSCWR